MKRMILYRKRSNIINLANVLYVLRDNSNLFLILSMLICGTFFGSVLICLSYEGYSVIKNLLSIKTEYISLMLSSTLIFLSIYLLILLFSVSGLGSLFIMILCSLAGIVNGSIVEYCLIEYGYKGIVYFFVSLLPSLLYSLFVIIILSNMALNLSIQTAKIVFFGCNERIMIKKFINSFIPSIPLALIFGLLVIIGKWFSEHMNI